MERAKVFFEASIEKSARKTNIDSKSTHFHPHHHQGWNKLCIKSRMEETKLKTVTLSLSILSSLLFSRE